MKLRFTYIYIFFSLLLFALSYLLNYHDSRIAVCNSINERFKVEAVHYCDSIYRIKNLARWGRYDSRNFPLRDRTTLISVDDTIDISTRYFPRKDYNYWIKCNTATILIMSNEYSVSLVDSLFKNMLVGMGIQADAVIELHLKSLKEMFPVMDSMNVNVPVREVRKNRDVVGFVTDSVGIGICNQGLLIGKVDIPCAVFIDNMPWFTLRQALLLFVLCVVYLIVVYSSRIVCSIKNIHFIGNSCIDFNKNLIYSPDGDETAITGNKVILLKMFVASAPEYKLLKEDICRTIWGRDSKDGQALYHVAINELRSYLIDKDDSLALITLPKVGVLLTIDRKRRKHFPLFRFMWRFK